MNPSKTLNMMYDVYFEMWYLPLTPTLNFGVVNSNGSKGRFHFGMSRVVVVSFEVTPALFSESNAGRKKSL